LTYYLENGFDYCLLDDKQARKIARGLNVNVIGTIGILLHAKKKKLITSVSKEITKLEETINFRLSDDVKSLIIKEAGESG
ncbi:MAG: DUF3368 domain-containing protein, partial [Spirochaetales bacterium]|nr:DUF3368 domain-containing protein [Spirochaetales bacterium]